MTVFAAYGGVFALIMSIITVGYQPPRPTSMNSVASAAVSTPTASPDAPEKPSIDELVAVDVASKLAEETDMAIAANVANLSVSLAAKNQLAQTSDTAIVKPQIVQPTVSSRDIVTYVVKAGDNVQTIAANYNLKPETIRWANNLTTDSVAAGRSLTIPPTDGIVYTVKAGDTPESLAGIYAASKERIISFNDLELGGLKPGAKIVIPGGTLPEDQRPGYQRPISRVTSSYDGSSGYRVSAGISGTAGNRYAFGNCTYYSYERRQQLGRPVGSFWGNAKTWSYYARQDGFLVNRKPAAGAVFVDQVGYYGHNGVVESVLSNGDIIISEMNNSAYGGFNIVNRRTVPASLAAQWEYIH